MVPGLTHSTLPYAALLIALLVTLSLRQLAFKLLERKTSESLSYGRVALSAIRFPSVLWCFAISLTIAIHTAQPNAMQVYWAHKGIGTFLIISMSLVVAAVLVEMIAVYGQRNRMPFAVAGLSRTLIYVVVLSIGALMLMHLFGQQVTPILTALGVGGLAVALALQDTLANLFAGIHILVEEPMVVGDFIRLSTGEEGVVRDIGWRTTRIHTGVNNTIVIPNTKITSGILTNFSAPERRVHADVAIIAGLEADPEQVRRIALDVSAKTPGVLQDYPPVFLFEPGITPTFLGFKMLVQVGIQTEKAAVQSEMRLRILQQFRSEGVPLPSPPRVVIGPS